MKFLRKLWNSIKMGAKGAWKHKSMGLASTISIFATLFILGIILILTVSTNTIANDVESKVDEVDIFLKMGLTDEEMKEFGEKLAAFDGVKEARFRSSEEALRIMKESWGEDAVLLEGIDEDNVLQPSYIVKLKDIKLADSFVKTISQDEHVEDVTYYQDIVNQVSTFSKYVRIFGAILVVILLVISIFIISNTIKLTVFVRSKEISVMKYVGATNQMIRIPFFIEGLIFGLLGALLAYFAVYYLYDFLYTRFASSIYEVIYAYIIRPEVLKESLLTIFLALGVGIGTVGSVFSTRKHLKV